MGSWFDALDCFEKAHRIGGSRQAVQYGTSLCCRWIGEKLDDLKRCLEHLDRAAQIEPCSFEAWFSKGKVWLEAITRMGEFSELAKIRSSVTSSSYVDEKGTHRVHSKEFKAKEIYYEYYDLAQQWIKRQQENLFFDELY